MNADDLDLLVRRSLERDASTQPVSADLHDRSVAYGRRIIRRRRAAAAAVVAAVTLVAVIAVNVSGESSKPTPAVQPTPTLSSIAAHVEGLTGQGPQKTTTWWYERIVATKDGRTDIGELWQSRSGDTKVLLDGTSTKVAIHNVTESNVGSDASMVNFRLPDISPQLFYSRNQESVKASVGSDVAALPLAGDMFGRIEPLMELGEFPPVSRALLLRTLALVPDVQLHGMAKDATGRLGVVVDPPNAGFTAGKRYLIDPSTGLVLETQTLDAHGAMTARTTFVSSAAVPAAHALPVGVAPVKPYAPAPLPSGVHLLFLP